MSTETVTASTEVRHLPPWVRSKLGQLVEDRTHQWQAVMAAIPCTPPWQPGTALPKGKNYPRKYSTQEIKLLEQEVSAGRASLTVGSGMALLLEEWGCSGRMRPTLRDLIALLERCNLCMAAGFLRVELLRESVASNLYNNAIQELDDLLEEHNNREQKSLTVFGDSQHLEISIFQPVASEELLAESNDANNDKHLAADLNEDPSDDVCSHVAGLRPSAVPHIPYEVLLAVTDGFSELPVTEGGSRLGQGAFGVVYCAEASGIPHLTPVGSRQKKLAIKKLNFEGDRMVQQFKTEVEILSECNNKNILPIEGYSCDGPQWCIVYSFMLHGNLQDRLACTTPAPVLTATQRIDVGEGTAQGLAYLHTFRSLPMIHRDIKSANILLDENMQPKIGDFGLVRLGGRGSDTTTFIKTTTVFGTSAYMAPEAFRGDVSVKVDTFSYGVVLLELLTGLAPYDEHRDGRDLLSHIEGSDQSVDELADVKAMPWPPCLPALLHELAMLCLEEKKKVRPSMVEVCSKWPRLKSACQ